MWAGRIFYLPKARKEQKAEQVEVLAEKLKRAKVALLTDYRGLTVPQIQDLRGKLRTGDVEFRVVKNTLARRAADAAGVAALQKELEGPVAIAFGYDDLSLPSRLINEWVRPDGGGRGCGPGGRRRSRGSGRGAARVHRDPDRRG